MSLINITTCLKVLKLKSTAIKILEIMCEETSPLTKDLVKNVFKAVDINTLHTSLAYFYKLSQDEEMVNQCCQITKQINACFIETFARK